MWALDLVRRLFGSSEIAWRLCHKDATLECRMGSVSAGTEIQVFYRGELYHQCVHPSRADAEDEARRKHDEMIHRGWVEYGPATGVALP